MIFLGSREPVVMFYIEINGSFIFNLRVFTIRTVFIEIITYVLLKIQQKSALCTKAVMERVHGRVFYGYRSYCVM